MHEAEAVKLYRLDLGARVDCTACQAHVVVQQVKEGPSKGTVVKQMHVIWLLPARGQDMPGMSPCSCADFQPDPTYPTGLWDQRPVPLPLLCIGRAAP